MMPLSRVRDGDSIRWIDGVVTVSSDEAITMARRMAREEGISCGISSGCNVVACLKVARTYPALRQIVTMINDNGLRYLSTELGGSRDTRTMSTMAARERPPRSEDTRRLAGKRLVVID